MQRSLRASPPPPPPVFLVVLSSRVGQNDLRGHFQMPSSSFIIIIIFKILCRPLLFLESPAVTFERVIVPTCGRFAWGVLTPAVLHFVRVNVSGAAGSGGPASEPQPHPEGSARLAGLGPCGWEAGGAPPCRFRTETPAPEPSGPVGSIRPLVGTGPRALFAGRL